MTHNFNLSSVSSTNQEYRIHGFWNEADFFFFLAYLQWQLEQHA